MCTNFSISAPIKISWWLHFNCAILRFQPPFGGYSPQIQAPLAPTVLQRSPHNISNFISWGLMGAKNLMGASGGYSPQLAPMVLRGGYLAPTMGAIQPPLATSPISPQWGLKFEWGLKLAPSIVAPTQLPSSPHGGYWGLNLVSFLWLHFTIYISAEETEGRGGLEIRDVRISILLYNSFLGPILKALGAIDQAIIMKKFNLSPFKSTFKGPLKSTFTQVFPKWTFLEWTLMDFNGPAPPQVHWYIIYQGVQCSIYYTRYT